MAELRDSMGWHPLADKELGGESTEHRAESGLDLAEYTNGTRKIQ